ncbi:MAG: hypothetical protein JWO95_1127 [Verrucomicrobiales bacterium]|nr:hypothetical protein [Verrucomicrobiales bacterium]
MNSERHFEAIVSEHYEGLYRFAMSLTRSESDASDLTQHTFYVWATKGHQLRDLSKAKTWLYTTLHRAFLQSRRTQVRYPRQDFDEVVDQLQAVSPVLSDRLDSMQVLPALGKVDASFQAAVALFYLEDYSYRDIALILDVPVGTVKSRIARGIAQLREVFLSDTTDPRSHVKRDGSPTRVAEPLHHLVNHRSEPPQFAAAVTIKTRNNMIKDSQFQRAGRSFGLAVTKITLAALMCATATLTTRANDHRIRDLTGCEQLAPSDDNKIVAHLFATGVQIYRWDGSAWVFVAPSATLFEDPNHHAQVGTHFGTPTGPSWQTKSGSLVIEQRVASCTPDTTAIPWLLLRTISRTGPGLFEDVSHVQRLNTVGGIAPATPGASAGEEVQVPYTADYVFYRSNADRYRQANLVSDLLGVAQLQDTNLVNSWGITFSGTGPFWVADNGARKATLYAVTNVPNGTDTVTKQALQVTIPGAPTGVVSNNKGGFNGDVFLFATLNGRIAGWRGALGTTAETLATRAGAVYTGLTLTTNSTGPLLVAANFAEGTVDVYGANASLIGQFADSDAPLGYAPFNVQSVNGTVFVMFAKRDETEGDDSPGRGSGLIDVFDSQTGAFHRFASGKDAGGKLAEINAPWGVALAPFTFGKHGGDLLVGNFGDGTIMTFGLDGKFHGLLKALDEHPIQLEGLWGLSFGNDGRAGSADTLFFASGPLDESHGLVGSLKPADNADSRK